MDLDFSLTGTSGGFPFDAEPKMFPGTPTMGLGGEGLPDSAGGTGQGAWDFSLTFDPLEASGEPGPSGLGPAGGFLPGLNPNSSITGIGPESGGAGGEGLDPNFGLPPMPMPDLELATPQPIGVLGAGEGAEGGGGGSVSLELGDPFASFANGMPLGAMPDTDALAASGDMLSPELQAQLAQQLLLQQEEEAEEQKEERRKAAGKKEKGRKKNLFSEDVEGYADRLHYGPMASRKARKEEALRALQERDDPRRKLTPEAQRLAVHRLYDIDIMRIKDTEFRRQMLLTMSAPPSRTISEDRQAELMGRLYYKQREHTSNLAKNLTLTHIRPLTKYKVLSKDQQEGLNKRLFYLQNERSEASKAALAEKYLA